jgi:MraZ protein
MFLGQHTYFLDDDLYLTIPAAFREAMAGGAYVTQGFERNLVIMTEQAFQELYQRVVAMNIANPLARLLLRMILGNATRLETDQAGRFRLPADLVMFAGLEKKVVLVGQGDYFEVWAPSLWDKQSNDLQNTEANTERFAVLDLAVH